MNPDETRVFNYLKANFGENVIFEPDGQVPPDFVVNSSIAIEVRRLNQNFFEGENSEGLEQISVPLFQIINDVLASFDSSHNGKTYLVSVRFKPYFCANTRHFYSLVQTQAVSNRYQPPKQYLSKQIARSFENWF